MVSVAVLMAPPAAFAQRSTGVSGVRPPARLFSRLFPADPRGRLRVEPAPPRTTARERPANRECEGCEGRPGMTHVIVDSPLVDDAWLARHTYQANGGSYGDNAVVADFWYDAVHRRILTRSAAFHDVDDPADVRLGRAPGEYPNRPDFRQRLPEGTTVGQVGFDTWTNNGFGAYFAAVQGAIRDVGTGYLDLTTTTGQHGRKRDGGGYEPGDLVKHVRLHPSGQLEIGFQTDPDALPDPLLLVRGTQRVEGALVVGGGVAVGALAIAGGAVPHACSLSEQTTRGRIAVARCQAGQLAVGGGGSCGSGDLRGSRPRQTGGIVDAWEITCGRTGSQTASVICCAQ
jgi:hypothetical protein